MSEIATFLGSHDFRGVFVEALGWDRARGTVTAQSDGISFELELIAHKRGLQVLTCRAHKYTMFNRRRLREVQKQVLKQAREHIIIYCCDSPRKQVWQWAVRLPDGRRLRHREHPFFTASLPERLLSRLELMRFSLAEEDAITMVDAADRVRAALDTDADQNGFSKRPKYAEESDRLVAAVADGGSDAFTAFVTFHLPLATWGAKQFRRYFALVDEEDRIQIAAVGLVQAAKRFDPDRGFQFSTYAQHWIRQACQRDGLLNSHLIRIPPHVMALCWPIRRRLQRELAVGGPEAASHYEQQISQESPSRANCFAKYCAATSIIHLSTLTKRERNRLPDRMCRSSDAAHGFDGNEHAPVIAKALSILPPGDAEIIRRRYGFDGKPETLVEIAQRLGVTRERIRQRQVSIERRLGRLLSGLLGIPLPRDTSSATSEDTDSEQMLPEICEQVLAEIRKHRRGISSVELAARLSIDRGDRRAAMRALLKTDRILQIGTGRAAVFRAVKRKAKQLSLFEQ